MNTNLEKTENKMKKISNMKETLKEFRREIKKRHPEVKVSISQRRGGYTSHINIKVVKAKKMVEWIQQRDNRTDEIKIYPFEGHAQVYHNVNEFLTANDTDKLATYRGAIFTEYGKQLMTDIINIVEKYNYDESEITTDYFDIGYYTSYSIGSYDKKFEEIK